MSPSSGVRHKQASAPSMHLAPPVTRGSVQHYCGRTTRPWLDHMAAAHLEAVLLMNSLFPSLWAQMWWWPYLTSGKVWHLGGV
jgi:hypothetical protein